ncbi:N-acetyltransferase [Haloarchaeobius sp. HME9146]|uniref:GNAT family N-acetyltransferase n=1 Tax=Haloarchaeobius sp. HME9146 TaxID=2978732 RepID=UPI0021C214FA|nr:GNAT family N-acetyltransferase [Haloarchaeobius sp. HME9146]MCT9096621.1 GNAT family N-acetyltransferase [Haloarchaeobius sp. HME9146]
MTIEPATLTDLDTLTDQWVALATEQRPHGSAILPDANRDLLSQHFAHHIVDGDVLVDRVDDRIVGFVMFERTSADLEVDVTRGVIQNLYVVPEYRGAGRGSALLDAAEEQLRERGADVVQLEVMAKNTEAREFYERAGYHDHRVVMEKRVGVESDTNPKGHD